MEDIKETRLPLFRCKIVFSFLFLTFFGGKLHITKEFCNFVIVKQQKIRIEYTIFDEWYYQIVWRKKYIWETIKIK